MFSRQAIERQSVNLLKMRREESQEEEREVMSCSKRAHAHAHAQDRSTLRIHRHTGAHNQGIHYEDEVLHDGQTAG